MTEQDTTLLRHELERLGNSLDKVLEVQAEQGKSLALQAQSLEVLARKQQELQDTQREMAAAVTQLSQMTMKVQHNCEMRRESYATLSVDLYGDKGLLRRFGDLESKVSALSKTFWWAISAVGTAAAGLGGMIAQFLFKDK